MDLKHKSTVNIETERLMLRRFEMKDAVDMLRHWISDHEVQDNYCEPVYETKEAVEELLEKWISFYEDPTFYRWAIILKENGMNIGQVAFCRVYTDIQSAEVEYCVGKIFWNKGYVSEALRAMIDFAFSAGFAKVEGFHKKQNLASGRVMQKCGMQQTRYITRFEQSNEHHPEYVFYDIKNI